jgi:hypothetical protein
MSPSLHANVSHLHQTTRYPLRAWLTPLVAVTVLGLLTGIQLMAAPIKTNQTVKVVVGKHPPKDTRVAAEAEHIMKNWCPVLAGWLGKKVDKAVEVRAEFIHDSKGDIAWASQREVTTIKWDRRGIHREGRRFEEGLER